MVLRPAPDATLTSLAGNPLYPLRITAKINSADQYTFGVTSTVLGGVLRGWAVRGVPISRVYERIDEMVDLIFAG